MPEPNTEGLTAFLQEEIAYLCAAVEQLTTRQKDDADELKRIQGDLTVEVALSGRLEHARDEALAQVAALSGAAAKVTQGHLPECWELEPAISGLARALDNLPARARALLSGM